MRLGKRIVGTALVALLAFGTTGCSFSIGSPSNTLGGDCGYDELFSEKIASGNYKGSDLGFTLIGE